MDELKEYKDSVYEFIVGVIDALEEKIRCGDLKTSAVSDIISDLNEFLEDM